MVADRQQQEQAVMQYLRILYKAVQAHSKKVETACGLSSAKLWMLHEISTTPGIKVSELAKALSIHPSTCSNMLDKIEDRGLIHRNRSTADQRAVHLHLTDQGRLVLDKAPVPPQGYLSSTLEKLSATQLSHLATSLRDFTDALHYDDERAGLTPMPGE